MRQNNAVRVTSPHLFFSSTPQSGAFSIRFLHRWIPLRLENTVIDGKFVFFSLLMGFMMTNFFFWSPRLREALSLQIDGMPRFFLRAFASLDPSATREHAYRWYVVWFSLAGRGWSANG